MKEFVILEYLTISHEREVLNLNEKEVTSKARQREHIFTDYPMPKAVAALAIPTMLGMFVSILYNLADTFFIGQLGDPNQVGAITIATPMFFMTMAFGSIFGVGASSYISRLLGMKKYLLAKQASAFSFYSSIVIGIIVTILSIAFLPPILGLSGATEQTYQYAYDYLFITLLGSTFSILSFAFGQIFRAEGAIKEAMFGMMLGTILNIVLDPIFIFSLDMGVKGAACATVISNFLVTCYYVYYLLKKSERLSISLSIFKEREDGEKFRLSMMNPIYAIGVPASMGTILMGISNAILNNFAASYGVKIIASVGIVGRINTLPILLVIGLAQGVQPLIGFNYGAKNYARLKSAIIFTIATGSIISIIFTALFYFQAQSLVQIFINDNEVVQLSTYFLRVSMLSMPFLPLLFVIITTIQSMGKGLHALVLSIARQGLIFIPTIIIANAHFGYQGIVHAQPIADILSLAVALAIFSTIAKQLFLDIKGQSHN